MAYAILSRSYDSPIKTARTQDFSSAGLLLFALLFSRKGNVAVVVLTKIVAVGAVG